MSLHAADPMRYDRQRARNPFVIKGFRAVVNRMVLLPLFFYFLLPCILSLIWLQIRGFFSASYSIWMDYPSSCCRKCCKTAQRIMSSGYVVVKARFNYRRCMEAQPLSSWAQLYQRSVLMYRESTKLAIRLMLSMSSSSTCLPA